MKPQADKPKTCILNCKTNRKLFKFPDEAQISKLWLNKLGLPESLYSKSEMYVCLHHFSSLQLTKDGESITPTSIPDKNIPIKQNLQVTKPKNMPVPTQIATNTNSHPKKPIVITSALSRCVLKCKNYKKLHRFPKDMESFKIWLKILGLSETQKKTLRISLCDNHFSDAMRTSKRITTCAVPDMNLPSQCTFIHELLLERMTNNNKNKITTSKDSNNIDTLPTLENTPGIILPDNYKNALFECVLKCPDSEVLYRFPNVESRRQLWLTKIGLTHCLSTTRICNRHFSSKMFSNKRLANFAYPDINLPDITKPLIEVASLPLDHEPPSAVQNIPQFICVLTVVTNNKNLESMVNSTKYVEHTVDKTIPNRERSVQVNFEDLIESTNKAIMVEDGFEDDDDDIDDGFDDDDNFEAIENIICEEETNNIDLSAVFPSKSKDMFECLKCGEITLDQKSNQRHLRLHQELSHLCYQCGLTFTSAFKLSMHETKIHSEAWKQQMVKRCPKEYCNKAFHSKKNFNQHLNEHATRKKHYCINCGRLFLSLLKLNCHRLLCKPKSLRWQLRE